MEYKNNYNGRHVIFLFPKGMWELLQNTWLKSETIQLASVAKLIRNAMFQTDDKFKF